MIFWSAFYSSLKHLFREDYIVITHRIHVCYICIYMLTLGVYWWYMLPYIAAPWILWDIVIRWCALLLFWQHQLLPGLAWKTHGDPLQLPGREGGIDGIDRIDGIEGWMSKHLEVLFCCTRSAFPYLSMLKISEDSSAEQEWHRKSRDILRRFRQVLPELVENAAPRACPRFWILPLIRLFMGLAICDWKNIERYSQIWPRSRKTLEVWSFQCGEVKKDRESPMAKPWDVAGGILRAACRERKRGAGGLKADIQASGKFYENMIELFSHFI